MNEYICKKDLIELLLKNFGTIKFHDLLIEISKIKTINIDTLNKGIDELIEKYKKEINKCDCDTCRACQTYHKVVQDLKKLKGE